MTFRSWKLVGAAAIFGAFLAITQTASAKPPSPKAPPSKWRHVDFNRDYKPNPRPKSPARGKFGLRGSGSPVAKDAPKPPTPNKSKWRDVLTDYKAKPRPKSAPVRGKFGLRGSGSPVAKDAPKPTDPPTKWRYFLNDYQPKPRPKSAPVRGKFGLRGSGSPVARDAKPTEPPRSPTQDRFKRKGPPQRPTRSRMVPDPIRDSWPTRKFRGPPPPRSRNAPRAGKPLPPTPRDVKIPYVHPPRDLKDLKKRTRR